MTSRLWTADKRPIKRSLSLYEKQNLPNITGRALLLPAEPNTEIEELVDAGVDPWKITCVEQDPDAAAMLRAAYGDYVNLFEGDVFDIASRYLARGQYGYIHLDLLGQTDLDMLYMISLCTELMAVPARFRVSTTYGRKDVNRNDDEFNASIVPVLQLAHWLAERDVGGNFHFEEQALAIAEAAEQSQGLPLAASILCKLYLDLDVPYDIVSYIENEKIIEALPVSVNNAVRYRYTEKDSSNHMLTMWFDRSNAVRHPDNLWWLMHQSSRMFTYLDYMTPSWQG